MNLTSRLLKHLQGLLQVNCKGKCQIRICSLHEILLNGVILAYTKFVIDLFYICVLMEMEKVFFTEPSL